MINQKENINLEVKQYRIDENIILNPVSNKDEITKEYVAKIHKHHNSIDDICPVKNIGEFEKMENSVFWIIHYDNNPVGFLNLIYRKQCIENTLEIHRFYIDEEYREYGIGSKVINGLKLLAKEKGFSGIVAKVYCNNPAINFYERNDFQTYYRYMITEI